MANQAEVPLGEGALSLVNRAEALSRVGGDEALLKEIADIFLEECPKNLAQLRDAIAQADAPAVERIAHGLKGAVANFASHNGVAAALQLERMGHHGELLQAPAALATLETAMLALSAELERF